MIRSISVMVHAASVAIFANLCRACAPTHREYRASRRHARTPREAGHIAPRQAGSGSAEPTASCALSSRRGRVRRDTCFGRAYAGEEVGNCGITLPRHAQPTTCAMGSVPLNEIWEKIHLCCGLGLHRTGAHQNHLSSPVPLRLQPKQLRLNRNPRPESL